MIRTEHRLIRRGLGRRPLLVVVIRRDGRRARRAARAMRAAGRPVAWIARALGVARARAGELVGEGT